MWRALRSLPLLALLAACATAPQAACPADRVPVADLPAQIEAGRLLVHGTVAGADTVLLVDTGAERSVLTTQTIQALSLPRSQRSATRLTGVGGVVSNADAYADLELGGAGLNQRLPVADVPGLGGIVGADLLSRYDLEIDGPGQRVRLWPRQNCRTEAPVGWRGGYSVIPVTPGAGGRLRVAVTLDGQPVNALLDSGASRSLLSAEAAGRLGISAAALSADPGGLARGVDGTALAVRGHRFASMTVGPLRVGSPVIEVADLPPGGPAMLLGMDWLRGGRIWIAYGSGRVFRQ